MYVLLTEEIWDLKKKKKNTTEKISVDFSTLVFLFRCIVNTSMDCDNSVQPLYKMKKKKKHWSGMATVWSQGFPIWRKSCLAALNHQDNELQTQDDPATVRTLLNHITRILFSFINAVFIRKGQLKYVLWPLRAASMVSNQMSFTEPVPTSQHDACLMSC